MTDPDKLYAPVLRDLMTGREAVGYPMSLFWWGESNGSCDCNRLDVFEKAYPDHERTPHETRCGDESVCLRCLRYVIVGLVGVPEEETGPLLAELNCGYAPPWGRGWESTENEWDDEVTA